MNRMSGVQPSHDWLISAVVITPPIEKTISRIPTQPNLHHPTTREISDWPPSRTVNEPIIHHSTNPIRARRLEVEEHTHIHVNHHHQSTKCHRYPSTVTSYTTLTTRLLILIFCTLSTILFPSSTSDTSWTRSAIIPDLTSVMGQATGTSLSGNMTYTPANCSFVSGTCIRIGIFYCSSTSIDTINSLPAESVFRRKSSRHCATINGYNDMVDWYRTHIEQHYSGHIGGLPVFFIPATLPPDVPYSRHQFADLVNTTFFDSSAQGRPLVDFVILPPGAAWDLGMVLLEAAGVPAIASNSPLNSLFQCGSSQLLPLQPPCTTANTRRFQFAHGLANADGYMSGWISLLQLRKISTIGIVVDGYPTNVLSLKSDTPILPHAMLQPIRATIEQTARDNNFWIVYDKTVNITSNTIESPILIDSLILDPSRMDTVVNDLRSLSPDAIVLVTAECESWLDAFQRQNYFPSSLAITFCDQTSSAGTSDASDLFVVTAAQWSPKLTGTEYTETIDSQPWAFFPRDNITITSSPKQFQTFWQNLTHAVDEPTGHEAAVLAAFSMLEGGIFLSSSFDPLVVNRQLQLYFQPSYFGLLTTNRFGVNQQKQIVSLQRTTEGSTSWSVVAPQASAELDLIFPAPNWSDRIYERSKLGRFSIEYIILVLLLLCGIGTITLMVALVRTRLPYQSYALAILYYLIIGIGCLLSYASSLSWKVDHSGSLCTARIWLWTCAFHCTMDPLMAGTYQMWIIMKQAKQQSTQPTAGTVGDATTTTNQGFRFSQVMMAKRIGLYSLVLFIPHIILNLIWTLGYSGLVPTLIQPDPLRASQNYTACLTDNTTGLALLILTVVYCFVLLAMSMILSWRIRKSVATQLFYDARPIGLALYIFTLTALVVLAVQVTLNPRSPDASSQAVLFGLRSIGILIAYQGCFALLVGRRVFEAMIRTVGGVGGTVARDPGVVPKKPLPPNQLESGIDLANRPPPNLRIGLPSTALKSRLSSQLPPRPEPPPAADGGEGTFPVVPNRSTLGGKRILPPIANGNTPLMDLVNPFDPTRPISTMDPYPPVAIGGETGGFDPAGVFSRMVSFNEGEGGDRGTTLPTIPPQPPTIATDPTTTNAAIGHDQALAHLVPNTLSNDSPDDTPITQPTTRPLTTVATSSPTNLLTPEATTALIDDAVSLVEPTSSAHVSAEVTANVVNGVFLPSNSSSHASAVLPHFCQLPTGDQTAALTPQQFVDWCQHIQHHADAIEELTPMKELERQADIRLLRQRVQRSQPPPSEIESPPPTNKRIISMVAEEDQQTRGMTTTTTTVDTVQHGPLIDQPDVKPKDE